MLQSGLCSRKLRAPGGGRTFFQRRKIIRRGIEAVLLSTQGSQTSGLRHCSCKRIRMDMWWAPPVCWHSYCQVSGNGRECRRRILDPRKWWQELGQEPCYSFGGWAQGAGSPSRELPFWEGNGGRSPVYSLGWRDRSLGEWMILWERGGWGLSLLDLANGAETPNLV